MIKITALVLALSSAALYVLPAPGPGEVQATITAIAPPARAGLNARITGAEASGRVTTWEVNSATVTTHNGRAVIPKAVAIGWKCNFHVSVIPVADGMVCKF